MKKYTILELFLNQISHRHIIIRVTRLVPSSWSDCNDLLYAPLSWVVPLVPSLIRVEDLDLRLADVGDETREPPCWLKLLLNGTTHTPAGT